MTDYSKLSDFEINKKVDDILHPPYTNLRHVKGYNKHYCNNPTDAWSIIVANKISIVSLNDKWIAAPVDTVIDGITGDFDVCFYASDSAVTDVNPLRAAMIVFLQMQEDKQ
ncbi:NinX [Salmonella phage 9NA]|uniref:NinX n=1 Tax=Salmonella phage 9NA TaxID=1113547 RepID=A0A060DBF8_9CAUD|nr:NinX [Salmonella phage 9NA]AIB07066.1 NinX [Salmonella phage 9NA]